MERHDIDTLIDKLIIIPDTNIFLYLYKCSFSTSYSIVQLMNKLKCKIIIPYRVAEEYQIHKHKEQARIDGKYDSFTRNIKKQILDLQKKIEDSIAENRKYDFPDSDLLQLNLDKAFSATLQVIDTYDSSLLFEKNNKEMQTQIIEKLVDWFVHNKKVRAKPDIATVLAYIREGEFRYRYKMPPGYMDEDEKDKSISKDKKYDNFNGRIRKYGDLFIWKDILSIGKEVAESEKYVLFLTNDIKEDWWVLKGESRSREPVRMRDELLEEYKSSVGNDRIEFINLGKFYSLLSDYYQIQNIKTQLEIDYDTYVNTVINDKHKDEVTSIVDNSISEIEWAGIIDGEDIIKPEIEYCDFMIVGTNIHYDKEDDYAIYDVQLCTETYPIEIFRRECHEKELFGRLKLLLKFMLEIQRDLRNLEDEGVSLKSFTFEIKEFKEPWEVREDDRINSEVEITDSMEDSFSH